jgi:hypothetical protein
MKILTIDGKDYTLEYSFMAAEHNETIQKIFNIVSGAYLIRRVNMADATEESATIAMIEGTSEMVADIPHIVKTVFHSGLLEHHSFSEEESYNLMKQYMKENKISFRKLFEDIKECMDEDGFFDLSGLTEMLEEMNKSVETQTKKRTPKVPTDHKKKQVGTN